MIDPRWRTVLLVAPYAVIGLLVVQTLSSTWGDLGAAALRLALCAAAALWVLVLRDLPTPWRGRPATIAILVSGFILLNLTLVLQDGWFGFLTIATFAFAYSLIEWPWELLAVGATAVVAGLAQSSGLDDGPCRVPWTIAIVLLNVVIMCGLSWSLQLARRQFERAATAGERARLAREIHDTLAQGFAGIVTQLQAAEQAPDEAARARHTDAALALARDGLAEARRSVQALRPAALDAMRLPEALENVTRTWSARTGVAVDFVRTGDARPMPTDTEVALLRTAQEALANVERHADAHHVVLELSSDSRLTRLEVRDDGRGFDQAAEIAHAGGGYGLVAMRERVESVAGALTVESRPGGGTAIRAEVPA